MTLLSFLLVTASSTASASDDLAGAPYPYLLVEAEIAKGAGPHRVPFAFEDTFLNIGGDPTTYGFAAGLIVGPLTAQYRTYRWTSREPDKYPVVHEVRVGALLLVEGSMSEGWPVASPGFGSQVYVGYRGVQDMDSLLYQDAPVDGHGFILGARIGQFSEGVPVYQEGAFIAYPYAWPREDRRRIGIQYRGGFNLGAFQAGVRIDLDGGTGPFFGFELRGIAAVRVGKVLIDALK